MAKSYTPSKNTLLKAIQACIENAERLLEETYDLEFRNPPSSRFFLTMIAQEELAKAFILFLIKEDVLPFSPPVLRAINDHACKQLIGMIMDYMIMHWDDMEELKDAISNDYDLGDQLPDDVGSAMELLCYEKIGRWKANALVWAEGPKYDTSALRISKGNKDRRKQDALYVRIGRDGGVCNTPQRINGNETCHELERAKQYRNFLGSCLNGKASSHRYDKAMATLKILFEWERYPH